VRAADPAVQAQERDAVRLTLEHLPTGAGQPQGQPGERVSVAEGRGGRERPAGLGLDEPGLAGAESGERAEEPGVAEERRSFEVLLGDEGGHRRLRAGRDGLHRPSFGSGHAVARGRQFFEEPT
jgi:hypothetical protein